MGSKIETEVEVFLENVDDIDLSKKLVSFSLTQTRKAVSGNNFLA